jgi:hypothetical protein
MKTPKLNVARTDFINKLCSIPNITDEQTEELFSAAAKMVTGYALDAEDAAQYRRESLERSLVPYYDTKNPPKWLKVRDRRRIKKLFVNGDFSQAKNEVRNVASSSGISFINIDEIDAIINGYCLTEKLK